MTNPLYDPYQILQKVYGKGSYLKQAVAETFIEEINRARTVKIVYGVLENDIYLDFCIRSFAPKNPKLPVRTRQKAGQGGRGGLHQRLSARLRRGQADFAAG